MVRNCLTLTCIPAFFDSGLIETEHSPTPLEDTQTSLRDFTFQFKLFTVWYFIFKPSVESKITLISCGLIDLLI